MNRRFTLRCSALLGLVAAIAFVPSLADAQGVGSAAAVRPSSTGTPPGGGARNLEVGSSIVSRERIQTSGSGSLQVMFLDMTTLTVGPNSDLVVDEFVYNAGGGTGSFAASLSRGALRFVGGQISHNAGATINTPSATIGIRGGVAMVTHDSVCQEENRGKQCTKVVCIRGDCTVSSKIDSRSLRLKINEAVEIGALGFTQPFDVSSVKLNEIAKGGTGSITAGKTGSADATFEGQETLDSTMNEQTPPPPPPPIP
jgi:hypothetical protein